MSVLKRTVVGTGAKCPETENAGNYWEYSRKSSRREAARRLDISTGFGFWTSDSIDQ